MNNFQNTFEYIQKQVDKNKIDIVELCKSYLLNIKKYSVLNAFVEVFEEEAILQAKKIQKKIANKKHKKLAGLFIGIKDNISNRNHLELFPIIVYGC